MVHHERSGGAYQTTQRFYINPTSRMQYAVTHMPLPNTLKKDRMKPADVKDGEGEK